MFLAFLVSFGAVSSLQVEAAEKPVDRYFIEDIGPDHQFYEALERFVNADIIDGYVETETYEEDGEVYDYTYVSVRPDEKVTRAQFTKILVNALGLKEGQKMKEFPDVTPSKWYYNYVRIASSHGIITGRDGKFYPDENITRDQMAAMIYRAFNNTIQFKTPSKTFKDVPATSFAYEAVVKSAANGIIKGYGDTFKPHEHATRGQAVVMIDRALHQEAGTKEDETAVSQVVNRNITEEIRLTEEQDFPALISLYRETTTGYQLAYSLDGMDLMDELEEMEEIEGTLTLEPIGEHTINPVSVNKRLAEVRIDNLKYKVSFTSPDFDFNINVDASGTAFLKKDNGGKWKIYNIVLDEDYEEGWEAELSSAIN